MKRFPKKIYSAVKQPKKVAKLALKQGYVLAKFGPVEYVEYLKRAFGRHMFIHNFPNGIKTSLDVKKAKNWYLVNREPVVVVLIGISRDDISDWLVNTQKIIHGHFLVSNDLAQRLKNVDKQLYTVTASLDTEKLNLTEIKRDVQQNHRRNDVIFIDISQPLVNALDLVRLQHAAHTYDDDKEIGIVSPAYINKKNIVAGFEYDRSKNKFTPATTTEKDYGQLFIPRYVVTSTAHCLYITYKAIQLVPLGYSEVQALDFEDQISYFIAKAWKQNLKTLVFSPVAVNIGKLTVPSVQKFHEQWFSERHVTNAEGDTKVIYVLNATSVSGGIRVIFEHANGLVKRGFDVEIWSLQGQPTWTDLDITVKKFNNYSDMLLALRNEDAIKVATWWETAQIVWLASINHGVAVNFIQEFETWFYPNDPVAQAAVVSSYRKEFAYMTTADYQCEELRNIGIEAPIIPVGYEKTYYHQIPETAREEDVILALGRSFFQKNFAMTVRAWKSMADRRPRMFLFGSEPDVISDEKVTYYRMPSNAEVNVLYNTATCFIQTSRHEGFSLPIIEAMAAGCPVITTDSHGNRGFCHDGKNCIIVEQDDDAQLAKAIEKLTGDKQLQEKFRKAGLKTAQDYEWTAILDKLAVFYKKV